MARYQINKWLGLCDSYQFTYKEGPLFPTVPSTHSERYRHLMLRELVAFYLLRLYYSKGRDDNVALHGEA